MKPDDNRVDLLVKGDNALGSQYQPVDLGSATPLSELWINSFTRFIWVRPDLVGAVTDILTWVNATAIAITLVPAMPWVLIPLGILVATLAISATALKGMPQVLALVRLSILVATMLIVVS